MVSLSLALALTAAVLFGTSGSSQLAPAQRSDAVPAGISAPVPAPVVAAQNVAPVSQVPTDRLVAPARVDPQVGRLSIPAIGANAAIVRVSQLLPGRTFPVPQSVVQVAEYAVSDTTIMSGHVDSAKQGLGALYMLSRVQTGDDIWADGKHYRVVYTRLFLKSEIGQDHVLEDTWNAHSTPGRLVVVSCWGAFSNGHYDSNIVVIANKL